MFIVSIRKDVDNKVFKFPTSYQLNLRLVDILDMKVDEKFYLDTERANSLVQQLKEGYSETSEPEINVIGDLWADNGHNSMAGRIYDIGGIAPTLGASHFQQIKYIYDPVSKRIRSITPKECFRLLGFKVYEFDLAAAVNSNSQLFKQIGNSIAVDVAEELLCMLFDEKGNFFI